MPDRTLRPRDEVLRMKPYSPPTEGRDGKLRLDFNENTVGCSPAVIAFLRRSLTPETLAMYPAYETPHSELAAFFGVTRDEMLLTNGTDEAIQLVVTTYAAQGDEILLLDPSFAMYRFYAEVAGASIHSVAYRDTLEFPLQSLLEAIRPSTRAILIANPNNPTGSVIDKEGIRSILEAAPGAAVLIDEAYFEFCSISALEMIALHSNLFVSRTFSKAYGLAGLRIGCLFSKPGNILHLGKVQSPYSVNALAAQAAQAAVRDPEYVQNYVKDILSARALLCAGFDALRIPYFRSEANFVLFRAGGRAIEIRDGLRRRGVLVRDRSSELAGCVRVTVGTMEQVRCFLTELEKLW